MFIMDKNQKNEHRFNQQMKRFFDALKDEPKTMLMVAYEIGIERANLCRYKRKFEKANQLWEVESKPCKITGFRAWYLTTNPNRVSSSF